MDSVQATGHLSLKLSRDDEEVIRSVLEAYKKRYPDRPGINRARVTRAVYRFALSRVDKLLEEEPLR